ncbi:coagulation factor XIII B chain isoform X2 [Pogona vitticeps]
MEYKTWIFQLILAASGKFLAEGGFCDFPSIENGKIASYYYSFKDHYFPMKEGEKLSYSCFPGYTTESGRQEARINCTTRGWVPAPKCFRKCTKPPLDNGVFSDMKLSYKMWERLHYACNSGYQTPEGTKEKTVQCLQNGWSVQPQCIETTETCSAPELLHGHYHTSQREFSLNEKLRYSCDDGYFTAGSNTTAVVLCGPQGWSLLPKCTRLQCSSLSPVEHGGVHPRKGSYDEGDVVQFVCSEGYTLKGAELVQCYSFGWYPEPPICEEVRNKCPPPPQPPNTKLLTHLRTFRHGDRLRLECDPPFQIRGAEEVQCKDGKWTSPPTCVGQLSETVRTATKDGHHDIETIGNCISPPAVKNGVIINTFGPPVTSYQAGSFVEYRCLQFSMMKGHNQVHCLQGRWTEPPVCLEPCLANEENAEHHNLEMKWRLEEDAYLLHGDIIEVVCKPGYVLPPSVKESQLLVQCNDGELKYPTCISKVLDPNENCGSPPSVENGNIMGSLTADYAQGSIVEYSCQEYHYLQGSRTVSCSRGHWTTPPVCIEPCTLSQAEMANNNLNLKWSFDNRPYFLHGEFVEFVCKAYYMSPPSSSLSDFRVRCQHGQLLYPHCIEMRQ